MRLWRGRMPHGVLFDWEIYWKGQGMKFQITRTSDYRHEKPPCEGVQSESLEIQDWRTVSSLEEGAGKHWFKHFMAEGRNHRAEGGNIVRETGRFTKIWTMEIETLNDLMSFIAEHDSVVVCQDGTGSHTVTKDGKHLPSIEIYDDYRE